MAQTQRKLDKASVIRIMNNRLLATTAAIGRSVLFTVQGMGNEIDVKNKAGEIVQSYLGGGQVFTKKIFNLKANSDIAMKNVRNKQFLLDAFAAEKAGDSDAASELYSQYLNSVQLSFSIPTDSPLIYKLGDRVDVAAKLIRIDTDHGSLLTLDPASIRIVEPEVAQTTNFSFDDEDETVSTVAEALKA